MQQNVKAECPKCSRPLEKYNGHIGYCSLHKWVSPDGLGYDAEAAEQNRQDALNEEKSRVERERQKQLEKQRELQAQHENAVRKAIAAAVGVLLIAAAVVFFIVRPSINYNHASSCFTDGKFKQAQTEFSRLGNYKDSESRATLSGAMLDLQSGRVEEATAKLEQLSQSGQTKLASQLADVMLPVMENWKTNGLSPQSVLLLISKIDLIDPKGKLDVSSLEIEAHTALLDGTQLSVYADDINQDQAVELIVLNEDYSISVYRMTADANVLLAVDNEHIAACSMKFGDIYMDIDPSAAICCYAEANRLNPCPDTAAALAAAYQKRSSAHENAGDWQAALDDAHSALECTGSSQDFVFFYDMSLRYCKNGNDHVTAISMWEVFAEVYSADINKYSAQDQWNSDAADLHTGYAVELASKKDDRCIDELREAVRLGADVTEPLATVQACYGPGMALANLRLFELELVEGDAKRTKDVQKAMESEVQTAIKSWKELGISPSDVPALIYFADCNEINLSGINWENAYEEAALASMGNSKQYAFVNWNADQYKELLVLYPDGTMQLYAVNGSWQAVSTVNTEMPNSSFSIAGTDVPLILVLAENEDDLWVLEGKSDALPVVFKENNISRYQQNGSSITFSKQLEGSIVRYSDYAYEATSVDNRPIRTSIDWQQNNYPYPSDAQSTVERYFEAAAYQIPEEMNLLVQTSTGQDGFKAEGLSALAKPDIPGTTVVSPYLIEENTVLFEVEYPSGAQNIRTWVKAELSENWKVVGAADAYSLSVTDEKVDYSVPLIGLNGVNSDTISARGERKTYRVYVPYAGRMNLEWQSGSKASSRDAYAITMNQGTLTGDEVFSYVLQPNPNKQQSKDAFVSPGVYYVTVEARMNKAEAFSMTLTYTAKANVELEGNDTVSTATRIQCNEEYSAVLSSAKDEDYFSFDVTELSTVNIILSASGNGKKTAAYNCSVFSTADGQPITDMQVLGNAQQTESGNLYLQPGTYILKVSKGSTHLNDEYRLTVNATHAGTTEAERNDTAETATVVPVNTDILASIGQEGDIDWFTFTLVGDAVVQPRFGFTPTDSTAKTYVLTLMDSSRREVLKVNIGGKESNKAIIPAALPAGTYWIKLENPNFIRQDYTLHLVCMEVDAAEHEANNSEALATELFVGVDCTGVLTTRDDVDYYKMSFDSETLVTLSFSFAQSTNTEKAFVLTVEQNGKKQWSVAMTGDSGGMEQQLQFPAGEYYLKVVPENWSSAVYTLGIQ